jgi:hypothetical protein
VVSIYNDNFATLPSRPQYFIEVYRCVKIEFGECESGQSGYPVPEKMGKIEIVVPDIASGKDWDYSNKKKFYKYVVYNHTSCTCGTFEVRDSRLYQTITNNEGWSNEHVFVINFLSIFRKYFPYIVYYDSHKTFSYNIQVDDNIGQGNTGGLPHDHHRVKTTILNI